MVIMTTLLNNAIYNRRFFYALSLLPNLKRYQLEPTEIFVKRLEVAKRDARHFLKKMENKPVLTAYDTHFNDSCRVFLLEHKNWLRGTQMAKKDHHWALEDVSPLYEKKTQEIVEKK